MDRVITFQAKVFGVAALWKRQAHFNIHSPHCGEFEFDTFCSESFLI